MFKRLLAVVLAGCLVFDSAPITSYAAEPQAKTVEEDSVETTESSEEAVITEQTGTSEEATTAASEESTAAESASEETEAGTEENTSEATTEETASETETATEETVSETETATEETTSETETVTEESTPETETVEESISETETTEETVTEVETEEETLAEEETQVQEDAESEEVTALKYGETNKITLAGYDEENYECAYQWYSFTAPKAGAYNFYSSGTGSDQSTYLALYKEVNADEIREKYFGNSAASMHTKAMNAGDVIYIMAYTYDTAGVTFDLEIRDLTTVSLTKQEDGRYVAETDDYTFSVVPEAGCYYIRNSVSLTAKNDAILDSSYNLYYYYKKTDRTYENNSSAGLYSSNSYSTTFTLGGTTASEYNMYFVLKDSSDNIVAVFDGDIVLSTKQTDESIVIHETSTTESSIAFDMEVYNYGYCYYAPTDGSEEEKSVTVYSGWSTRTFTNLKSDTEYYFQFTDSNGKVIFEKKAKTAASTTTVAYTATASVNDYKEIQVALKADVSGYKGNSTYAYLRYEYTNALGEVIKSYTSDYSLGNITDTDGKGKSFTLETTLSDVWLADTKYDITTWLEIGDYTTEKKVTQVTTTAADYNAEDVQFSVTQNSTTPTTVDYSMQITSLENNTNAGLYYRQQGDNGTYSRITTTLSTTSAVSGQISGLQGGATYDFVFIAGGIKKEATLKVGTETVKLSKVDDGEVNAFDIVRTFKVEKGSESAEDLAEEYYLRLYYLNNGYYSSIGSSYTLNAENEYQATIKTADSKTLTPDTDYNLKWTLSTSGGSYTFYETVHTKKVNLALEVSENLFNKQTYKVSLNKEDIANFTNFSSMYIYGYIRKTGNTAYRKVNSNAYLSSSNSYSSSLSFRGLEASTAYEVSFRDSNGVEYATATFTTPEDTRKLTVGQVKAYLHYVYLPYTLTGTENMDGCVSCYIREKGTEGAWENANNYYFDGTASEEMYIGEYNNQELKDGTTYEYQVGISDDDGDISLASLEKVVKGEFSTAKDTRTLSNVGVSAGYTVADVSAYFNGNDSNVYSVIAFFYREKDSKEWITMTSKYDTYNTSYSCTNKLTGLKQNTAYEYAIVVSDKWNITDPDDVPEGNRKAVGEFTTKKCGYTLDFVLDESKTTNDKAVVAVTAKDSTEDMRVKVTLTLSDGQGQTITLKQAENYKKDVTFKNLLGETEYTITNAAISVTENNQLVKIADIACDYKFTTKKAEVPTSITLSEETLSLNAQYAGRYYDGYSSHTLEATAAPGTAAADFVWSSSNEAVATVTADGTVCAQGVGTAEITVASKYDESVKATCAVTVKNYEIGWVVNEELYLLDSFNYGLSTYKDTYIANLGLYEIAEDGTATALVDFNVSTSRENIVSWLNGNLHAIGVGDVTVIFEKDGIKAAFDVWVEAEGKGFGIKKLESSDDNYPAIANADGSFTLAYATGVSYRVIGEITPAQEFSASDFTWSISDETIATVDEWGNITPKAPGKVTLTVTAEVCRAAREYKQKSITVDLDIRNLPTENDGEVVYALANVDTKLGDVEFPSTWGTGWSWKYPDTPLVTNGVHYDNYYSFEAVYSGTESYPSEATLKVYIGRITGAYVSEKTTAHNQVLEVGGNDSMTISVKPSYQGYLSSALYTVEVPTVDGLTITKNDDGTYTITAQKAGKYTLQPVVKANDKVIAKTSYKIQAVEEKQVGSITFTTETEGVTIDGNKVIFDTVDSKKDFTLKATVKDRYGEEIPTTLQWKTTDKTVAMVAPVSKQDTHSANVTAKAEGHTVITVTAKDAAGYQAELDVEIQNHAPRVNKNKATVNIAYNYNDYSGEGLAYSAGAVEIVPVYGEYISDVQVFDKTGENPEMNLKLERYIGYEYLVEPTSEEIPTGTYDCTLRVTTNKGIAYNYPLKVSVVDKAPTVSVKMGSLVNLFFTNSTGEVKINISGNNRVDSVTWEDKSEGAGNGFSMSAWYSSSKNKYTSYATISQQQNLKVVNGSLQDANVAKGTLTVKVRGYRKTYTFDNFEVKYNYKKPSLVTKKASSSIAPSVGANSYYFTMYDSTFKRYIYYSENYASRYNYYFDEITCDSEDVVLTTYTSDSRVDYRYTGKESSKKITLTVDSATWREPLKATHTIKAIAPKAYLYKTQLTFNTSVKTQAYTYVYLKDTWAVGCTDIVIKGANDQAQKLLDDDLFVITSSSNVITVKQSEADLMGATIPKGTYSYKVTPYCKNAQTGEKVALNTLTLKIKVVDKPVTAKVSPKGGLDLVNSASYNSYYSSNDNLLGKNVVVVDPTFANWSDGYYVSDYKLVGEYSDYFSLRYGYDRIGQKYGYHYYITIDSADRGKLKAGQAYKLAVQYTVKTESGDSFTVTSNVFSVKPKQSKAKITVSNNNQILYAGAENNCGRTYYLIPSSGYSIISSYGSIDCNKDGKPDIVASGSTGGDLRVEITDWDAVGASASGKSYSIPVTVKLYGRDGISKDVTVSIKVKVKR